MSDKMPNRHFFHILSYIIFCICYLSLHEPLMVLSKLMFYSQFTKVYLQIWQKYALCIIMLRCLLNVFIGKIMLPLLTKQKVLQTCNILLLWSFLTFYGYLPSSCIARKIESWKSLWRWDLELRRISWWNLLWFCFC